MSEPTKIYLDTMLWNALCDSSATSGDIIQKLAARNIKLVLGLHNFYEFTKTFTSRTRAASGRARQLLSYSREIINADVLCAKEVDEVLAAEMLALKLNSSRVNAFLGRDDHALISGMVDSLVAGDLDARTTEYLEKQKAFGSVNRSSQRMRLENSASAQKYLRSVSAAELDRWLGHEVDSESGRQDLTGHILRRFSEASRIEAMEYAAALLMSPIGRMARGLVRASSYYAWRCANGSLPKDLFDDMYHVLSSAYCDIYATAEGTQGNYATLLLSTSTPVAIYADGSMPLDRWLEDLP